MMVLKDMYVVMTVIEVVFEWLGVKLVGDILDHEFPHDKILSAFHINRFVVPQIGQQEVSHEAGHQMLESSQYCVEW